MNLRLTVESVDIATRILLVTLQSEDLDDMKKEFMARAGNNGRQLFLKGIAKSGSDYKYVSGLSVRDFLRQNSVMTIDLKHHEAHKLRGEGGKRNQYLFLEHAKMIVHHPPI